MSGSSPAKLEVGRVARAHGLNGAVVVDFVTDRVTERTRPGAVLWAGDRALEVVSAQLHQTDKWLVVFAGVQGRDEAERLRGQLLSAVPVEDPDALFVHDLIGSTVVDQHGVDHGPVVAVVANPASDLLELTDGRLVPLRFVEDHDGSTVRVSVPAGLLDDDL